MARYGTDTRDIRHGTYDPINKDGLPQSHRVKDKATPHEKAQTGADVRADPLALAERYENQAGKPTKAVRDIRSFGQSPRGPANVIERPR